MDTTERIEEYLIRSGIEYESIGDGIWIVHDDEDNVDNIVVTYSPPVVVFRVKLMDLPDAESDVPLFKKLLELNANEMISGAYGLDGNSVILCETLQTESLDFNEFQAAVEGIAMALNEHYPLLRAFHEHTESDSDAGEESE